MRTNSTNLIFVLPKNAAQVEIIGTKVIPEFGSGLLILGVAAVLTATVFLNPKSQRLS